MDEKTYILADKLRAAAADNPQKVALREKTNQGYISYTYSEFLARAEEVARILAFLEIKKGDKAAIVLENCCEWGFAYFGIMLAGAIAVPLDPQANEKDIEYFLENSAGKLVFTSDKYLPVLREGINLNTLQKVILFSPANTGEKNSESFSSDKIIYFADLTASLPEQFKHIELNPQVDVDSIASILYTSGTTGRPKGVMLSQKNFCADSLSVAKLGFITSSDRILSLLPLHHSFPFMTTLIIPLFFGAEIIYPKSLQSDEILSCISETGITALVAVPQFYYLFYKNFKNAFAKITFLARWPLLGILQLTYYLRKFTRVNLAKIILRKLHTKFGKKMRYFISGGAKLDPAINRFLFKLGFSVYEGYGLTETSPAAAMNPLGKAKIGSVGKAIPGVEIRIDQPDQSGVGEVLIRGSNVMLGYYQLPDKTKEVFDDSWFRSGDLGYLDADDYLFIIGRKNELIVLASGKNLSPEEIESHYAQSLFIKELCIVVVGEGAQEKLMAVVVPDFAYFKTKGEINIHGSIKWDLENLSQQMPGYKRVMGFCIAKDDLPRTRLGKLRRYLIKEKYYGELLRDGEKKEISQEEAYSDEDLKILNSNAAQQVLDILRQELDIAAQPRLDDHLELDLGIDSLKRLEVFAAIENGLRIKIPEGSAAKIFSVRELLATAESLTAEGGGSAVESASANKKNLSWREILNTEPSEDAKKNIDLNPNWLHWFLTFCIDGFIYGILRLSCRLKIYGVENIPKDQACVLCVNHNSYLDGFIISASMPRVLQKQLFFLGLIKFIQGPVIWKMQKFTRIIPVDPALHLIAAMKAGAYVLKHGKILAIFPEGGRSIDGKVKDFKTGIGILLKELDILAVPVYIQGSFEAWPRTRPLPKPHPIKVFFGKPCAKDELKPLGDTLGAKDEYSAITIGLREKILEMENNLS